MNFGHIWPREDSSHAGGCCSIFSKTSQFLGLGVSSGQWTVGDNLKIDKF